MSDRSLVRVELAAVLDQLLVAEAMGEAREQPAGVDLGKLLRIPDEHDLRPGRAGFTDDGGETTSSDHAALVKDDHGSLGQLVSALGESE